MNKIILVDKKDNPIGTASKLETHQNCYGKVLSKMKKEKSMIQ